MLKYNISLENKTILITGVAGFIGSNLANRLLQEISNVHVIGIDSITDYYDINIKKERLNSLIKYSNFTFIKGNIADKKEIDNIINNNENSTILICSHGGTIRNIISYLLSGDYKYHWNFKIDNGSITEIETNNNFAVINKLNYTKY